MKYSIILCLISLHVSSCALIQERLNPPLAQTTDHSLSYENNYQLQEFEKTKIEMGYSSQFPANYKQRKSIMDRMLLKRLEKTINSPQERAQYTKYRSVLKNDAERIQFLKLKNPDQRALWAQKNKLDNVADRFSPNTNKLIKDQDISLGMHKIAVQRSWGKPKSIEFAGEQKYENEKWTYDFSNISPDGYTNEVRTVFFESGRVVGWSKE